MRGPKGGENIYNFSSVCLRGIAQKQKRFVCGKKSSLCFLTVHENSLKKRRGGGDVIRGKREGESPGFYGPGISLEKRREETMHIIRDLEKRTKEKKAHPKNTFRKKGEGTRHDFLRRKRKAIRKGATKTVFPLLKRRDCLFFARMRTNTRKT